MTPWKILHRAETASTNLDARAGSPWEVYTADYQTAGRGRLDHKWISPRGVNLMMSAVLPVEGLEPERIATLPLVVGLAVLRGLSGLSRGLSPRLKWPNDVLIDGRKVAGVLCERVDDRVIAGVGINVAKQDFPIEIASKAAYLEEFLGPVPTRCVRDSVLNELHFLFEKWAKDGFSAVYGYIREADYLKGKQLSVRQTDDDAEPLRGFCRGIAEDGTLDVGGVSVYAGEAHVEDFI